MIAIIAILAAILFPVFARARENARRSSCQSNLKQIGLGVMQYKQDYDEYYPSNGAPVNIGWAYSIQPYVKSTQLFQCPSETTPPNDDPLATSFGAYAGQGSYCDYFYNSTLTFYNGTFSQGRNDSQVSNPVLVIMAGDNGPFSASNTIPFVDASGNGKNCSGILRPGRTGDCDGHALNQTAAARHLEGANYAFADGHVKFLKSTQIYGNATPLSTSDNSPTFRPID